MRNTLKIALFLGLACSISYAGSPTKAETEKTLKELSQELISRQQQDGRWQAGLETDPSIDALVLLLGKRLHFLTPEIQNQITERIFAWNDYKDKPWSYTPNGSPQVDVTGVILLALKEIGIDENNTSVKKTWDWFNKNGGPHALNSYLKIFLVPLGILPRSELPHLTSKFFSLPLSFPVNIYNIGIIRGGLIPLTIWDHYQRLNAGHHRAQKLDPERVKSAGQKFATLSDGSLSMRFLKKLFDTVMQDSSDRIDHKALENELNAFLQEELIHELWNTNEERDVDLENLVKSFHDFLKEKESNPYEDPIFSGLFSNDSSSKTELLNFIVDRMDSDVFPGDSEFWTQEGLGWLLAHQQKEGLWYIAAWNVISMLALNEAQVAGASDFSKEIKRGWDGLLSWRYSTEDGSTYFQFSASSTWDTPRTLVALFSGPTQQSQLASSRGIDWLLSQQIFEQGDWSGLARDVQPGGWAFVENNRFYPDTDVTAAVLDALARGLSLHPEKREEISRSVRKGAQWLLGLQNADGGFGAWDKNTSQLFPKLLAIGMPNVPNLADQSQADVTARILKAFYSIQKDETLSKLIPVPAVLKACRFLMSHKTFESPDIWKGDWLIDHLYGTAEVTEALMLQNCMSLEKAYPSLEWIVSKQNADGGWGESEESYKKASFVGAPSTIGQTSYILPALLTYERLRLQKNLALKSLQPQIDLAIGYLLNQVSKDKKLSTREFTGVAIKGFQYACYHDLALYETVKVLGMYLKF